MLVITEVQDELRILYARGAITIVGMQRIKKGSPEERLSGTMVKK